MFCRVSLRVRHKQNKYPILFLTQGISEMYPELMDIRCQTTQIAISFAQSENILVSFVALKSRICRGIKVQQLNKINLNIKMLNVKLKM